MHASRQTITMTIESEVLQQIEFEDIIEKFVAAKCRKVVKL